VIDTVGIEEVVLLLGSVPNFELVSGVVVDQALSDGEADVA
jgi:hypothetical protein